jgi:hypothetical protein
MSRSRVYGLLWHAASMLKITVSLIPGGVGSERILGELHITNVGGGAHADYECVLISNDLPTPKHATIRRYPRWSGTIWDLVARAIAKSLTGQERLPRRPRPIKVPIHMDGTLGYVRMAEIPEPVRSIFERRMFGSTGPLIKGEEDCVYAWVWQAFINGGR